MLEQKEVVSYNHSVYNLITMAKKAATKMGRPKKPTTPTFDADAAAETIHRMMDKIEGRPKNMRDMQPSDFPATPGIPRSKTDQQFLREFVQGLSDEVKQLVIQEAHDKTQVQQALKGPEYKPAILWADLSGNENHLKVPSGRESFVRAYNKALEKGGKPICADKLAAELCRQLPVDEALEKDFPEIPQQVKELYQSTERLCTKVAELEKALESVLKGAVAIVKTEPKDAYSPLGRDLSRINARLSGLNEAVHNITLSLAI